jgi:hypothetical protein
MITSRFMFGKVCGGLHFRPDVAHVFDHVQPSAAGFECHYAMAQSAAAPRSHLVK